MYVDGIMLGAIAVAVAAVAAIVIAVILTVAIWRMMRAHERLEEHVASIARRFGGPPGPPAH